MLPETQVRVEVLEEEGRWAQEPWKPQLVVKKGDIVTISISFAMRLKEAGLGKILKEPTAKKIRRKSEKNPAEVDKQAAES